MQGKDKEMLSDHPDRWPTFPAPPTGVHGGERLLLGVGYLTTAAIYLTSLANMPDTWPPARWMLLTALFALFAFSLYLLPKAFKQFWTRLGVLLFQIALVAVIVLVGEGMDFLPILFFIVIPIAYLSFRFAEASGMAVLCLVLLFLALLSTADLSRALSVLLPYGGGFAFFAVVSTALVQQQRDRQKAEQLLVELEDAHRQLRLYAAQVEALAVAEERNRIAREIHDSLGHYLTAMTMQLQAAGKLVVNDSQRAAESIARAEEIARESLAEVRRSVAALRTSPVDTTALDDAIHELVQNFQDGGIVSTFKVEGKSELLPVPIKTALYRAAQEGLTNICKHANASAVEILLAYEPERVELTITDNGTGPRSQTEEGFGLMGLRERLTLLGGLSEAGKNSAGGFRLHISVPLQTGDFEHE